MQWKLRKFILIITKKIDSELTERDITGIAVITAHDEPQEFFNQIRIALLQVGMNLMEEKDKV